MSARLPRGRPPSRTWRLSPPTNTATTPACAFPIACFRPCAVEPGQTYPLFTFLHGAGERGDDNLAQLSNGVSEWLGRPEIRERFPAYCLVPQCPVEQLWSGKGEELSGPGELVMGHDRRAPRRSTPLTQPASTSGGLSMGGFGTWDLITHFPDTFAAGIMICGGGDPSHAAQVAHVPFWLFHGEKDEAVLPALSHAIVAELNRLGGTVRYTEYPDVGHQSWFPAFQGGGVAAVGVWAA